MKLLIDNKSFKHSLVIIRNDSKFLTYEDEGWRCKLFINYKTVFNNEESIVQHIAKDLNMNPKEIHCKYITDEIHSKFSVSHNENRIYEHSIYELTQFDKSICKDDDFVIGDKHYYWMTIGEMKKDNNIIKKF